MHIVSGSRQTICRLYTVQSRQMGCRLQFWLLCRIQMEVGAPNVDFILFIVGNGNADFRKRPPYENQSKVDEPVADFGFFLGTVQSQQISCRLQVKNCAGLGWSRQTRCRLQFILAIVEVGTGIVDSIRNILWIVIVQLGWSSKNHISVYNTLIWVIFGLLESSQKDIQVWCWIYKLI